MGAPTAGRFKGSLLYLINTFKARLEALGEWGRGSWTRVRSSF